MSKVTIPQIQRRKAEGPKISVITAYDYPSAQLVDAAGIDIILVGDSLGNVVQGKSTTLPVTVEEMIYHAEMVVRAAKNALVVVDLPFPYCQLGPKEAVKTAAKILKNTLADAVKIEGGENRRKTIQAVVEAGIPVMGHCGLQPQRIKMLGRFSLQRNQEQLQKDINAIENAGAFAAVLECVAPEIADEVTRSVGIPTIGIGAGPHCDGQVLVYHDLLGFKETAPKHVKVYANLGKIITDAVKKYCEDVREGAF
ncbi:MAG: 3-methyl-2-oxobutanoate hydroxymethyltransferase [Planctomycetaceae bacterium]|nr:3-methyl-2-oxobutanoate hydroxymethyltransferase [Planctomycetaceae bacterium]